MGNDKTLRERFAELREKKTEYRDTKLLISLVRRRCEYRITNMPQNEDIDRETAFFMAVLSALLRLEEFEEPQHHV